MMKDPIHQEDIAISNLIHWRKLLPLNLTINTTEFREQFGQSIILKTDFNHWTPRGDLYNGISFSNRLWQCSCPKLRFSEGIYRKPHSWEVAKLRFKFSLLWPQGWSPFQYSLLTRTRKKMTKLELFFNIHNSFGRVFFPPQQHRVAISPHLLMTEVCVGADLASRGSPHRLSHCQGFLH